MSAHVSETGKASILQYRELLKNLVVKDLKIKYSGSLLGFLWSLLNPLAMILIYSLAFKYIMRVQLENVTLFYFVGMLPWHFFSGAISASTVAVISNANLIKKIHFPREILPISTVLFHFAQFLLALSVFFPALLFLNAKLTAALAVYPLVLFLQLVFTVGLALFLSAMTVFYRDIKHLVEVGLIIFFWMTPIIYHLTMVPESVRFIFKLNPLAAYITAYQDILYVGRMPSIETLLLGLAWAVGALIVGEWVFRRQEAFFVEEL